MTLLIVLSPFIRNVLILSVGKSLCQFDCGESVRVLLYCVCSRPYVPDIPYSPHSNKLSKKVLMKKRVRSIFWAFQKLVYIGALTDAQTGPNLLSSIILKLIVPDLVGTWDCVGSLWRCVPTNVVCA